MTRVVQMYETYIQKWNVKWKAKCDVTTIIFFNTNLPTNYL